MVYDVGASGDGAINAQYLVLSHHKSNSESASFLPMLDKKKQTKVMALEPGENINARQRAS